MTNKIVVDFFLLYNFFIINIAIILKIQVSPLRPPKSSTIFLSSFYKIQEILIFRHAVLTLKIH